MMAWFLVELSHEDANKIERALSLEETVQITYGPNHEDPIDIDRIDEYINHNLS